MWEYLIIGAIFTLLIFIIETQFTGIIKKVESIEAVNIKQELHIQELRGKLWSEDKLEKSINNSVKAAMNTWMIESVKDGTIQFGKYGRDGHDS